jgi:SHS2 domain-containing protein
MPIPRSHRLLPHTADAGLEATAPGLPELFEEAALALAELTSDRAPAADPGAGGPAAEAVELSASDLAALAFAWLDELIGRIDMRASALDGTDVRSIEPVRGEWRLEAAVRLVPFDGVRIRRRAEAKSATYHGLAVEPAGDGWRLVAYLDV